MNPEEEKERDEKRVIFFQWLDEVFKTKMLLGNEETLECDTLRVRRNRDGKRLEVSAENVPDQWHPFSNTKELNEILSGKSPHAPNS